MRSGFKLDLDLDFWLLIIICSREQKKVTHSAVEVSNLDLSFGLEYHGWHAASNFKHGMERGQWALLRTKAQQHGRRATRRRSR